MQKHFLKFGKVFINVACSPLILISNNSELAAKYLPCLLYTSDAADERSSVDLGGRRIIKKNKSLFSQLG